MRLPVRKVSDEVYIVRDAIVSIGRDEVAFVKTMAAASARRRARICAHRDNDEALQEMIIAVMADSYLAPHRHVDKAESFHIIEGSVDVVIFDDAGEIAEVVCLGDPTSGRSIFYRLSDSRYHALVLRTPCLVMHESTNGPFLRERTIMAPFAPPEGDAAASSRYMSDLAERAARYLAARPAPADHR